MAFPASGLEATYRNAIDDVASMLDHYHGTNFMIWNLSGRSYDYSKFNHQVLEFYFPDHHSPPLDLLFKILLSMDNWLSAFPGNVAVIHCKGGKGRTGTVISCFLTFKGIFEDAETALEFFGQTRSTKERGVTQVSQRRYVKYFSTILEGGVRPYPRVLRIRKIIMSGIPRENKNGCVPFVQIFDTSSQKRKLIHTTQYSENTRFYPAGDHDIFWEMPWNCKIKGDILMKFCHLTGTKKKSKGRGDEHRIMFRFAFHTAFAPIEEGGFLLRPTDMDIYKKPKRFMDSLKNCDFKIILLLDPLTPDDSEEDPLTSDVTLTYQQVFQRRAIKKTTPVIGKPSNNKIKMGSIRKNTERGVSKVAQGAKKESVEAIDTKNEEEKEEKEQPKEQEETKDECYGSLGQESQELLRAWQRVLQREGIRLGEREKLQEQVEIEKRKEITRQKVEVLRKKHLTRSKRKMLAKMASNENENAEQKEARKKKKTSKRKKKTSLLKRGDKSTKQQSSDKNVASDNDSTTATPPESTEELGALENQTNTTDSDGCTADEGHATTTTIPPEHTEEPSPLENYLQTNSTNSDESSTDEDHTTTTSQEVSNKEACIDTCQSILHSELDAQDTSNNQPFVEETDEHCSDSDGQPDDNNSIGMDESTEPEVHNSERRNSLVTADLRSVNISVPIEKPRVEDESKFVLCSPATRTQISHLLANDRKHRSAENLPDLSLNVPTDTPSGELDYSTDELTYSSISSESDGFEEEYHSDEYVYDSDSDEHLSWIDSKLTQQVLLQQQTMAKQNQQDVDADAPDFPPELDVFCASRSDSPFSNIADLELYHQPTTQHEQSTDQDIVHTDDFDNVNTNNVNNNNVELQLQEQTQPQTNNNTDKTTTKQENQDQQEQTQNTPQQQKQETTQQELQQQNMNSALLLTRQRKFYERPATTYRPIPRPRKLQKEFFDKKQLAFVNGIEDFTRETNPTIGVKSMISKAALGTSLPSYMSNNLAMSIEEREARVEKEPDFGTTFRKAVTKKKVDNIRGNWNKEQTSGHRLSCGPYDVNRLKNKSNGINNNNNHNNHNKTRERKKTTAESVMRILKEEMKNNTTGEEDGEEVGEEGTTDEGTMTVKRRNWRKRQATMMSNLLVAAIEKRGYDPEEYLKQQAQHGEHADDALGSGISRPLSHHDPRVSVSCVDVSSVGHLPPLLRTRQSGTVICTPGPASQKDRRRTYHQDKMSRIWLDYDYALVNKFSSELIGSSSDSSASGDEDDVVELGDAADDDVAQKNAVAVQKTDVDVQQNSAQNTVVETLDYNSDPVVVVGSKPVIKSFCSEENMLFGNHRYGNNT